MFKCVPCNFESNLRANFTRHTNTSKHIKICECKEVVSKVEITVNNTNEEVKEQHDIMDKLSFLTTLLLQQNEEIKELKQKINQIIESKLEICQETKLENVILYPIEIPIEMHVETPIEMPIEMPIEIKPKKQRMNITLIEDKVEVDLSDNLIIEKEKMKMELEKERMKMELEKEKMKMQLELQKMKMKLNEETNEDIINKNRYGMKTEVSYDEIKGNRNYHNEGCLWEITNNLNITEKEIINISNSFIEDDDKKNKETKINVLSDKLKHILNNIDESKRPLIYINKQLYVRNLIDLTDYNWEETRIDNIIEDIEYAYAVYNQELKLNSEKSMNFMNIIYGTLTESDYKKILNNIMPYISIK